MVKGKFQAYFPFEKNSLTYSCLHCRAHLARHDDLISKSFQGSQGRAYLFNQAVNVRCAEAKQRVLLTGLHFVADIFCACCDTALGWKYERAFEPSQRYKEGKVIIELVHLFKDNSWDAEWLYPLYPTSSVANGNNSDTTLNYSKPHPISVSDYHHSETGRSKSSLKFPLIDASNSLSSTDGGVFESSTTDLIDPNEETCTDFEHSHHHSHPPPPLHRHHHQLHHHLNTSPSSSTQVHQSSFSLMSNDSASLAYRLSSSLNATGWAFRIPPPMTSNNDGHDKYLLRLSDSGRVSDYSHTCTSTSATENVGHLNPVCSTDNNNSDSDDGHVGNLMLDSVIITNIDKSNTRIHNNTDNKTRIVSSQTGTNVNNTDDISKEDGHFTKSKPTAPVAIKLSHKDQNNNSVDSNNNNNSEYSCLVTDAYDIFEDINFNNGNNHRPMDDLCLRKLSQFSTPQARRISKINTQNLRVTFNSNLGKRNRKRSKHRLRASSASPSRDFLLPNGSEEEDDDDEEETDDLSNFTHFNNQSQNIVKVQD
uniref:Putative fad NAD binding oxidoreductases n=1 Tax=Schistosoma mansoni TaxID=6183 RepID=A0A3Q0KPW0_SCHMA